MASLLFLNSLGSRSRGCIAVQIGCINSIRASIPDADITIWSTRPNNDKAYDEYGVNLCQHPWFKRQKSLSVTVLMSTFRIFTAYIRSIIHQETKTRTSKAANKSYDVLISLNMDGLNDRHYGIFFTLQGLVGALFSKVILKRPMILIPASVSPLKNRFVKLFTRYTLNRFDIVTARGQTSLEYLKRIGVTKPKVYLASDLGFLLPPCSQERVENILKQEHITTKGLSLIGVAPSIEMSGWAFPSIKTDVEKKEKYIELMAETVDYIIDRYNAVVCFVPNVAAGSFNNESADSIVAKQIINRMKHTDGVKITSDSYSASEIKGIIGKCDMFFSCRLHPAIASTSMCVPTVVLAYGTKFDDVIGDTLGQQKCIVRTEASPEHILVELKTKLDYVWANGNVIRAELSEKTKIATKQALLFGRLVKQVITPNNVAV